jgi:hypothetical protein
MRINNAGGFSLIEVIIAAGLLVVGMFASIEFNIFQNNLLHAAERRNTATYQLEVARIAVMSDDGCTKNLKGLDVGASQSPSIQTLNFYDSSGAVSGAAMQVGVPHDGLTPRSITVRPGQMIGPNLMVGKLEIDSVGADTGAAHLLRSIPVKMWLTGTTIQTCKGAIEFAVPKEPADCTLDATGKCVAPPVKNLKVVFGDAFKSTCPDGWELNDMLPEPCSTIPPDGFVWPVRPDVGTVYYNDGTSAGAGPDDIACSYKTTSCECKIRADLDPKGWQSYIACKPAGSP